jgi:Mn2+/Fe2+ NRAMP family transporter
MLILAISLFILAAMIGVYMLSNILKNEEPPRPAIFSHGSIAFIAFLILVSYAIAVGPSFLLILSIVLFILAEMGGITLLIMDTRNKPLPKPLAYIHAMVAGTGILVLVIYLLKYILK